MLAVGSEAGASNIRLRKAGQKLSKSENAPNPDRSKPSSSAGTWGKALAKAAVKDEPDVFGTCMKASGRAESKSLWQDILAASLLVLVSNSFSFLRMTI